VIVLMFDLVEFKVRRTRGQGTLHTDNGNQEDSAVRRCGMHLCQGPRPPLVGRSCRRTPKICMVLSTT
jgi:hypothetical protein